MMIHLEIGGERYAVAAGETVIGSDPDNAVVLGGEGVQPRHAVVEASPPGTAAIRVAAREAEVKVNGVRLGAEPTPLLHGDKIAIGTHELRVVDSTRGGSTQLFDSGAFTDLVPPKSTKPPAGTTNGRLVCLTDGREYKMGNGPLTLGRDAASDVVVSGSEVSRQHAEIRPDPQGYLLVDVSVNGTYVNGERIAKTHRLARADVIRIGNDEFRFYADSPPAPAPSARPEVSPRSPQPAGAAHRLSDTMMGIPTSAPARTAAPAQPPSSSQAAPAPAPAPAIPAAPPLASLLLRSGQLKGERLPIKVPVVNIGRGDFNDVIIADPSVSTMHAKLQRRDAIWILTDLGSTNGTYIDGERLTGEAPLSPGTTIKFGDIVALFEPLDESARTEPGDRTRMMDRIVAPDPVRAPESKRPADAIPAEEPAVQAEPPRPRSRRPIHVSTPRPRSPSTLTVVGLLILVVILAYLLASF
ncbi:MAG TPA: FHA domain-containing protein [Gemmatimonadales bacterium]|nr:FHA domain-containing protein [Gemmatimonadales bacterium]